MTPRRTRTILVIITVAVAATRFLAAAHSLWEWDETLFCLSLRNFDVAAHHPHPPGFPLYVVLGKLFRLVIPDDFRALRAVNLLAASLVFPATYLLARVMTLEFVPSIVAGLLTAFAPNVWFYGGTAFSDEPTLTLLLFGCALLLQGRTSRRAYYAGCIVMAAACVMRPQNVLIGAYPWLAASWPRWQERRRDPVIGLAIIVAISALFFGAAAYLTGFEAYRDAVRLHGEYVMRVDSYHNPARPPWWKTCRPFFFDPYQAGRISAIIGGFAGIGVLRMRRPVREALATFVPFLVFAMFMLNVEAAGRYAITVMPLLAIAAAEGIRVVGDAASRKRETWSVAVQLLAVALILTRLIRWTLPALAEVRKHDSPPVEAVQWIHRALDRRTTTIYVHGSMAPWAEYLLSDYRQVPVPDTFAGPPLGERGAWMIAEGSSLNRGAQNFVRPGAGHLLNISRKRYFKVSVRPLISAITFGDGWYGEEFDGQLRWRWMARRGTMTLEPFPGTGELGLKFNVPASEPREPVATISFNGAVIDRFTCGATVEKVWRVRPNPSAPNVVTIELDEALNPAAQHIGPDPRALGLQLVACSWQRVR